MERENRGTLRPALRAAFPVTIPIMAGFLLTGATCGVFAVSLGLEWWMPTVMSIVIFAGSAEFVVASMLAGAFNPLQAFITIFIVNARHLFYGLSMLERFRAVGRKRPYLIYAMCDETFSLNYTTEPPSDVDRGWYMFWISLLNQAYWVAGCTLGGIVGYLIPATVKGISFAMTALFVVIFLDQWLKDASHAGALVGFAASIGSLIAFGPSSFMIASLALILIGVTALRGKVEPVYDAAEAEAGAGSGAGPSGGRRGDAGAGAEGEGRVDAA